MVRDDIANDYFEWMYDLTCGGIFSDKITYRKLLMYLHTVEFTYTIPIDENRADDGEKLRRRYSPSKERYLTGPCSVLEMMVALAIKCEETIMEDPSMGDRTKQWFWKMVNNLGLSSMTDDSFDKKYVKYVVQRFLNREYEPDGKGGLFTVHDAGCDLRDVEIFYQLLWYLDTII